MTKLQIRALIFQLLSFGAIFIGLQLILKSYSHLSGMWLMFTAFVAGTLLAPQFQAVKTHDGEHIFMRWIFMKGFRKIK